LVGTQATEHCDFSLKKLHLCLTFSTIVLVILFWCRQSLATSTYLQSSFMGELAPFLTPKHPILLGQMLFQAAEFSPFPADTEVFNLRQGDVDEFISSETRFG
jgi:hypothetical protein